MIAAVLIGSGIWVAMTRGAWEPAAMLWAHPALRAVAAFRLGADHVDDRASCPFTDESRKVTAPLPGIALGTELGPARSRPRRCGGGGLPPLIVAAVLTVAAWAWLGRPVDLPPAAAKPSSIAPAIRRSAAPRRRLIHADHPEGADRGRSEAAQPVTDCIRIYAVTRGSIRRCRSPRRSA